MSALEDPLSSLVQAPPEGSAKVLDTLVRARAHLLGLQQPGGWWKAELETNVTMDAEDLLLRHFLGILEPATLQAAAQWIRAKQREDGTWGTFEGAPPDPSATVEAYVALRLAGDDPQEDHMKRAAAWVRGAGGVDATRVFTRVWLAVVGLWDWEKLPVLPAEIMFLPTWGPLSIYDFGCWARQTVVALSIVMAHRPARAVPFSIDELLADAALPSEARPERLRVPRTRSLLASKSFELIDEVLHYYERLPAWVLPRRSLRQAALARAEHWIIRRQEDDGCWGGIQPPLVWSVIALHLQGYSLEHPVIRSALEGMEDFILQDEKGRRVEACQSPVWDTALALIALIDAGVSPHHPQVAAGVRWLLKEEVRRSGDWSVRRPNLAPGGWAFEFANDNYPDIDDTAEVVLALRRAGIRPGAKGDGACRRAVAWTIGMQSRCGGWGAFDVDNDSALVGHIPFCDFGEVTDPPSSDVTAHVVEMLATEPGVPASVMERALRWLSEQQEPDGSWFGRWGVNYLYGTGAALPALAAAGVESGDQRMRRAVAWIEAHQNPDGGWGEDLRSYVDDSWRGRGESTPSQTAWALMALLAAGERDNPATRRGVDYLVATQGPDGSWDEPWFTGTGFPWDFTINYHLYRLVWPVTALGRYLSAASDAEGGAEGAAEGAAATEAAR